MRRRLQLSLLTPVLCGAVVSPAAGSEGFSTGEELGALWMFELEGLLWLLLTFLCLNIQKLSWPKLRLTEHSASEGPAADRLFHQLRVQ